MSSYKTEIISEFSFTKLRLSNLSSKSKRCLIIGENFKKITVNNASLFRLVDCIVKLQHFSSKKRVIPIDKSYNLPIRTVRMNSGIDIIESFLIFFVDDKFDFLLGNIFIFNVFLNKLSCMIR